MFTVACCLVVGLGLGLGLGLDLVSGWLVVVHTHSFYFRLSLSHRQSLDALRNTMTMSTFLQLRLILEISTSPNGMGRALRFIYN